MTARDAGLYTARFILVGAVVAFVAFVAIGIAVARHNEDVRERARNAGLDSKATYNERIARERSGGFTSEELQAYHLGLEHIRNQHENLGAFTIRRVIDEERGREQQRTKSAQEQDARREAAIMERQRKEQAAHEARAAAIAEAESRYLQRGRPSCLVLDRRSLHTESGEYTWYINGKVQNRCDSDMRYVAVHFGFYDSSGNLANSGLINVNNLAAGETWAFRKAVYESNTSGGKWGVQEIIGY